jgi:hypothetical protein
MDAGLLAPGIAIFMASLLLTIVSLWIGARLAPWFLKEPSEPPPTVRSYFLEPAAELNMTRVRITTMLIASAILLFALLIIAIAVKFGGVAVL